jgi:hypothetical protein
MLNLPNGKVTTTQVLLPVALIALVLFIMLSFEFTQIMRDRSGMRQALVQQENAFEQAVRTQNQVNALAVGTQRLADKGNKGAKAIIERMNKLGIMVNLPGAQPAAGAPPAPSPKAPKAPLAPPPAQE